MGEFGDGSSLLIGSGHGEMRGWLEPSVKKNNFGHQRT